MYIDTLINTKSLQIGDDNLVTALQDYHGGAESFIFNSAVLKQAKVFDINNVYEHVKKFNAYPRVKEIINIALPFDQCWFEFKYCTEWLSKIGFLFDIVVNTEDLWSADLYVFTRLVSPYSSKEFYEVDELDSMFEIQISKENGQLLFVKQVGLLAKFIYDHKNASMQHKNKMFSHVFEEPFCFYYAAPLSIVFLALSILNCKNTQIIKHKIDEKLQKSRIRQNKQPLFSYHTLEIQPIKKISLIKTDSQKTDVVQRFHMRRGHFRDYKDGKGLFGKYHGLYWVPDHTAGSSKQGFVLKDYKISPVKSAFLDNS